MNNIITIKNFHATKLNNNRNLHIYLPPSYYVDEDKRYPVLYMHDGQGIFDTNHYSQRSWNMHETTEKLILENKIREIIIVGVDSNTNDRNNELTHSPFEDGTKHILGIPELECKGELYEDFLIHEVMPYIDKNYRTLTGKENTALMGSSNAGLATYNIIFRNPDVFGMAGILSPYFLKLDLNTLEEVVLYKEYQHKSVSKLWLDIGEVEANILPRHVRAVADKLIEFGYQQAVDFAYYLVPDAAHTETDWANRVAYPLLFMFGEIGEKLSVKLYGRSTVGLRGMKVVVNPVVVYRSGFKMSELEGTYRVSDPSILQVTPNGTIIPKRKGTAIVTYKTGSLSYSKEYTVVDEVSEMVSVYIAIDVPEDTPVDAIVYVNKIRIKRAGNKHFAGIYKLPRDIAMQFIISCVDKANKVRHETDINHNIVTRRFKAENDMAIHYTVSSWSEV